MARRKCGAYTSSCFNSVKHLTIVAAEELFYGKDVIEKLKEAKTESELARIMQKARLG